MYLKKCACIQFVLCTLSYLISNDTLPSPSGLSWWRHQMETFFALLVFCEGNPPVTGGFPSQRPVTWSFDVSFDMRLNKRLSKHSRRWFETPSLSLWRHCYDCPWGMWMSAKEPWKIRRYPTNPQELRIKHKNLTKTVFIFHTLS